MTERIPETRETAGGEGGTRRRSAGAGPGHRGSWGNSTLGEEKNLNLKSLCFDILDVCFKNIVLSKLKNSVLFR